MKYGQPDSQRTTGKTVTLKDRNEDAVFVEIPAGYFRTGSHVGCNRGSFVGRFCDRLGLPWGDQPTHSGKNCPPRWVEIDHAYWFCPSPLLLWRGRNWHDAKPEGSEVAHLRLALAEITDQELRNPTADEAEFAFRMMLASAEVEIASKDRVAEFASALEDPKQVVELREGASVLLAFTADCAD